MILEVELTEDEFFALKHMADKEKRTPSQQAAYIVSIKLLIEHYLPLKRVKSEKVEEQSWQPQSLPAKP